MNAYIWTRGGDFWHYSIPCFLPTIAHPHVLNYIQTTCMKHSSGFGLGQMCLFALTRTNNQILLSIDMKVTLLCILSVLFGLKAAYVIAAVRVIVLWLAFCDNPTPLFTCGNAALSSTVQDLHSCLHCWPAVNYICLAHCDCLKCRESHKSEWRASSPRVGPRTPSLPAFVTLWGGGGWRHSGDKVMPLVCW